MKTEQVSPITQQPQQIDKILLPHEAAEFLGVTEDELHNATCQGYLPGVCIDGHWRYSKRALSKFCWQKNNHNGPVPWREDPYGPYWLGDWVEQKASGVIEAYKHGERYFPELTIKGGCFEGIDLCGIDFWNSSLDGANFSGCILKNATFVEVSLKSAIFRNADLTDASFSHAVVEDADFRGAILNRTDFRVLSMQGIDLSQANINLSKF